MKRRANRNLSHDEFKLPIDMDITRAKLIQYSHLQLYNIRHIITIVLNGFQLVSYTILLFSSMKQFNSGLWLFFLNSWRIKIEIYV